MSSTVLGVTRSISACKRCRQKKIKCSHEFPKCAACKKAGVDCVSLDPATGRQVPRSYIVHLEDKIAELENFIKENSLANQQIPNSQNHKNSQSSSIDSSSRYQPLENELSQINKTKNTIDDTPIETENSIHSVQNNGETDNGTTLLNSINAYKKISQHNDSSKPMPFSGDAISFSKLMFAAVHFKDNQIQLSEKKRLSSGHTHYINPLIDPTTSSKSSFSDNVALLPPKQQALDFISIYFSQSNSQLPIFHRQEFFKNIFIPIYGDVPDLSAFTVDYPETDWNNFPKIEESDTWYFQYTRLLDAETGVNPEMDPFKFAAKVNVPKRFRKALYFINIIFALASSTWHLQFPDKISENFKNAALLHIEEAYSSPDRLEALQAMLTLTLYSLMRPCVPGVWYLLGSSLRLCIDLGLHNESLNSSNMNAFIIDMRRRLFWCCYSLDRQICVYLGRPFGIPEESIKVEFPSILDDQFILPSSTKTYLYDYALNSETPSYKNVSILMFRIRQLQAEIQSILYDSKELPRRFCSLDDWSRDMGFRLDQWKNHISKTSKIMDCNFATEFFELNYYHAKIMLHGLSPARYLLTTEDFKNVAGASEGVLLTFNKLWIRGALNYTWAVTQNVFMAHMSFLYTVFNCDEICKTTPLKKIKQLATYSNRILKSLIVKCNAAEKCLEVLSILVQAVIKLKYASGKNTKSNNSIINNTDMKRLPSEDDINNLQAGGNVTGNMRRLVVSIPELIHSDENKSITATSNNDLKRLRKNDREPKHLSNMNASSVSLEHKNHSLEINRSESRQSESSDNGGESLWKVNGFDLDNFFEKVRKAESPISARSISRNPTDSENSYMKPDNKFKSHDHDHFGTEKYLTDENEINAWRNRTNQYQMNHHNHVQPTQQPSPLTLNSKNTGSVSLSQNMLSYNLPTASPLYASSNGTPIFSYQSTSTYPTFANIHDNGKRGIENLGNENSPSSDRRESKEGERVYKLMLETGTESIWDQFFAQPFKLDDDL